MTSQLASHTASTRRRALVLIGQGGLLLAGGCSLPGSDPPPELYVLTPKSTFPDTLPSIAAQLVVDEPFAAAGLDTARIALAPDEFRLEYFARAAWSDRAPAMIQTLIVESFENTGKIIAISRDNTDLRPDYILKTELREFQAVIGDNDTPPRVLVQLNAKLVTMPQRLIFANNTFEAAETATSRDLDAVVTAFDLALGAILKDMIIWTLQSLPATARHAALPDGLARDRA